jgi:hypothetical protein
VVGAYSNHALHVIADDPENQRKNKGGIPAHVFGADEEMVQANANLIAASPDLLTACKAAHKSLCGCDWTEEEGCGAPNLLYAIAKAEGRGNQDGKEGR